MARFDDHAAFTEFAPPPAGRRAGVAASAERPPAIHIRLEVSCIAWPDGAEHRLGQATGRIVAALVDLHQEAPGAGISRTALQDIGWPGERMSAEAGANRVYVALAQLRRMGLQSAIERCEDGYRISPSIRVCTSLTTPRRLR